jgi:hypothetical protein
MKEQMPLKARHEEQEVKVFMSNQVTEELENSIHLIDAMDNLTAKILSGFRCKNVKKCKGRNHLKIEKTSKVIPYYSAHIKGKLCAIYMYQITGNHDKTSIVRKELVIFAVCDDDQQKNASNFVKNNLYNFPKSNDMPFYWDWAV